MQQRCRLEELRCLTVQGVPGRCRRGLYVNSPWNRVSKLRHDENRPVSNAFGCLVRGHAKNVDCQTPGVVRVGGVEKRGKGIALKGGDDDNLESLDAVIQKFGIHSTNASLALNCAPGEEELQRKPTVCMHCQYHVLMPGFLFQKRHAKYATDTRFVCFPSEICAEGPLWKALKLYDVLQAGNVPLKYNTFQAMIARCLKSNDLQSAVKIFRDLQKSGLSPNQVTYCSLISALGKTKRQGSRYAHLAYELWKELVVSVTLETLDMAALRTGMKASAAVFKMDEAEGIIDFVNKNLGNADVRMYNILLKGYASVGNMKKMLQVKERILQAKLQPSSVTYNTMIHACIRGRNLQMAKSLMQEAETTGAGLDAWSYTTLIKGYVEQGDMKNAMTVFDDMQIAGKKPTYITYSIIIDGFVRSGQLVTARSMLDRMVEARERPTAVTFNTLLRGYSTDKKPGALHQALLLLDDMVSYHVVPEIDTFNTLMSAAVDADDLRLAVDIFKRVEKASLRPDGVTYTILLQAYAKLGRVIDAVATFEKLSLDPNAIMDIAAYNAMVDAFARGGDMEAAEKMLERACEFARHLGKPPPVEAYGAVVSGYARLKQMKSAVKAVRNFHAAGGVPDQKMLNQLVDVCIHVGDYKLAMQAIRAMELSDMMINKERCRKLLLLQMNKKSETGKAYKSFKNGLQKKEGPKSAVAEKNVYLERFKFWLGLPNKYYE